MQTYRLSLSGSPVWQDRGYTDLPTGAIPGSVPSAPPSLTVGSAVAGSVPLTWTAATSPNPTVFPVTGYNIYSTVGGVQTHIGSVSASTLTFTDTAPAAGNVVDYDVTALNAAGESTSADLVVQVADGTITSGTPGQPLNTAAIGLKVTWSLPATSAGATYKNPNYSGLFTQGTYAGHDWTGNSALAWKNYETSQGHYDFSALISMLSSNPSVYYRFHFHGADGVPAYLATQSGGGSCPVYIWNNADSVGAWTGAWWTPVFKTAWNNFIAAAGAALDGYSNLVSVTFAGCSPYYDEPMILGGTNSNASGPQSGANTANYVDPQGVARPLTAVTGAIAMIDGVAAMCTAFPETVVEFAMSGGTRQYPNSAGTIQYNWANAPTVTGYNPTGSPPVVPISMHDIVTYLDATWGGHLIFCDYGAGYGDLAKTLDGTGATNSGGTYDATKPTKNSYSWMFNRAQIRNLPIGWQLTASKA